MKENWPKIAIFAGMLILQIGIAYGLVTYILPPKKITISENTPIAETESDSVQSENPDEQPVAISDTSIMEPSLDDMADLLEEKIPAKEMKNAVTITLDDFIINPAQTRGTRYIVLSLSFVASGKEVEKKVEEKKAALSDGINTLISRKTVAWLSDIDNRPYLREEVKLLLEGILGDVKVLRVYFTKYLFQ